MLHFIGVCFFYSVFVSQSYLLLKSDLFVVFFTQDRDYIPPTEEYSSQSDSCDKMDRDNLSVIKYNNVKILKSEKSVNCGSY